MLIDYSNVLSAVCVSRCQGVKFLYESLKKTFVIIKAKFLYFIDVLINSYNESFAQGLT